MNQEAFSDALSNALGYEGVESNDKFDPGGHTYFGISRVYWPHWLGWAYIDEGFRDSATLHQLVIDFYLENFWHRIDGDFVSAQSKDIAIELFEEAVNLGVHEAIKILQEALNMQNWSGCYPDLQVDGRMGPKTKETLSKYMTYQSTESDRNEKILLNCMNGEQYIRYKTNPKHEYYRGWFLRV